MPYIKGILKEKNKFSVNLNDSKISKDMRNNS